MAQRVDIPALKETLINSLNPQATIPASYSRRMRLGGERVQEREDPLEVVLVGPEFPQPMYEALRDLSQDWLLPGLNKVPANTVSLLETNQRFVEAYMVGLNHEMMRECRWREFPIGPRWTCFRQFWDVAGYEALKDIKPIHSWSKTEALGASGHVSRGSDHLVLLIRGELLRRYPNALIYAAKAGLEAEQAGNRKRVLTGEERHPVFGGTLKPDVSFFGFDLSASVVRGDLDPEADQGWFFVLQEQPSEALFGLDTATINVGSFPDSWTNLSWDHLAANEEDLAALVYVDLESDFPDFSEIPVPQGVESLAWGRTSSDMAYITLQPPVRVAIHGSDMLAGL